MTLSNCNLCDLFMNQMSFTIVNNTICPDWYLNRGPLDLQSNTLPLCHGGCWHLVLITLVGLFNDSFAISRTAYLLLLLLTGQKRNPVCTICVRCVACWISWFSPQHDISQHHVSPNYQFSASFT